MKNLILIIVLLSSYTFSSAKALAPIENSSLYEHMVEVNAQWEKFKTACPNKVLSFNSEEERIQMHLSLVVKHLSNYVNPELSAKQLKNRSLLLNALSVYADYGQFPLNAYHSVRTPYFIDDYGTHCAVGYLMAFSGNESLSIQISDNQNFHYLIDIEHPDLLNWSKEFGFTLDELKWIQPSYNPTESFEQVGFGTNGEIIDFYPYYRGYVIGGNFDTLNAIPCLNIGNFENNQLSCIGEGVNGNIAAVSELQGNYYACGELLEDGKIYPLVHYDTVWHFIEIPNRAGSIASSFLVDWNKIFIAISHESTAGKQELWKFQNDSWELIAKVDGVIDAMEIGLNQYYFGGKFGQIIIGSDSIAISNNIITRAYSSNDWNTVNGDLPYHIKCIKSIGKSIYITGNCSRFTSGQEVCAARLLNEVVQPIILSEHLNGDDLVINSITNVGLDNLVLGGNFGAYNFINSKNLCYYNLLYDEIGGLGILDKPVNSIVTVNNQLYVGGSFELINFKYIDFLAKLSEPMATIEKLRNSKFQISPNPFTNQITIEGLTDILSYEIFDLQGKQVAKGELSNNQITGLSSIPAGSYILYLKSANQLYSKKILKL